MRTGFEAMRLGSIIYFIPFFFVLDPALIMQGESIDILTVTSAAIGGVILIAAGLQGYLLGCGSLGLGTMFDYPIRVLLVISGLMMALPGGDVVGFTNLELNGVAMAIALVAAISTIAVNRKYNRAAPA
jgi:TRAP-type uncharacterized transport system fused permease subunit